MADMDATDRRILTVLQKDGRVTNAELSEIVNLSPSACHRRVQRLEEEGYIAGYVALLDARRMGRMTTVFVEITLQSQAEDLLDAFEREVARVPDLLESCRECVGLILVGAEAPRYTAGCQGCREATRAPGPACAPTAGPVSTSQACTQSSSACSVASSASPSACASQWPTITRQRVARSTRRAT